MQKTFPLQIPGKVDARVVEAVKGDVRKYVKRERRKKLPEGFTEWTFACKAGPDRATAAVDELSAVIDAAVAAGATALYIEIIAQPGIRPPRIATL
jgi:Family of unknown function (DUF6172)